MHRASCCDALGRGPAQTNPCGSGSAQPGRLKHAAAAAAAAAAAVFACCCCCCCLRCRCPPATHRCARSARAAAQPGGAGVAAQPPTWPVAGGTDMEADSACGGSCLCLHCACGAGMRGRAAMRAGSQRYQRQHQHRLGSSAGSAASTCVVRAA